MESVPTILKTTAKDGHSTEAREGSLKLMVGPGDAGEPVVTIMLPNED